MRAVGLTGVGEGILGGPRLGMSQGSGRTDPSVLPESYRGIGGRQVNVG